MPCSPISGPTELVVLRVGIAGDTRMTPAEAASRLLAQASWSPVGGCTRLTSPGASGVHRVSPYSGSMGLHRIDSGRGVWRQPQASAIVDVEPFTLERHMAHTLRSPLVPAHSLRRVHSIQKACHHVHHVGPCASCQRAQLPRWHAQLAQVTAEERVSMIRSLYRSARERRLDRDRGRRIAELSQRERLIQMVNVDCLRLWRSSLQRFVGSRNRWSESDEAHQSRRSLSPCSPLKASPNHRAGYGGGATLLSGAPKG